MKKKYMYRAKPTSDFKNDNTEIGGFHILIFYVDCTGYIIAEKCLKQLLSQDIYAE